MGLHRLEVKIFKQGKRGRSAATSNAYRTGGKIQDDANGQFDFGGGARLVLQKDKL
jgi:hypothetical protein